MHTSRLSHRLDRSRADSVTDTEAADDFTLAVIGLWMWAPGESQVTSLHALCEYLVKVE